MPEYRVVISTANYVPADTPEAAAERAMKGFLKHLPESRRSEEAWKIVSVEQVEDSGLVVSWPKNEADSQGEDQVATES